MVDCVLNSGVAGTNAGPAPAPGTDAIIEATWGALRVSPKPFDHLLGRSGGHFRVAAKSGLTAGLSAGALLFAFRYGDNGSVAVPIQVSVGAIVTTAFTTAQAIDVDMINVRGWTASDTGGTAIVPSGNNGKNRQSMGSSTVTSSGDMRLATASALGAGGTKTADANANGVACFPNTNGLGTGSAPVLVYSLSSAGQHPLVYTANEGFNLRVVTAQGAAGAVAYYVEIEWAELAGF